MIIFDEAYEWFRQPTHDRVFRLSPQLFVGGPRWECQFCGAQVADLVMSLAARPTPL